MKKLLGIVVLGLLLSGCFAEMKTKYRQDVYNRFNEMNCKMDAEWNSWAREPGVPMQAVIECYKKTPVYRLCTEWDVVYAQFIDYPERVTKLRSAISEALIAKNEDPLKCRNPNNDNTVKLKKELKKAKARAAQTQTVYIEPTCWYETYTNINGATASRKVCK